MRNRIMASTMSELKDTRAFRKMSEADRRLVKIPTKCTVINNLPEEDETPRHERTESKSERVSEGE